MSADDTSTGDPGAQLVEDLEDRENTAFICPPPEPLPPLPPIPVPIPLPW
jgi:hypothetical protein